VADFQPFHLLENRILMRIHNNFLVTFILFEGTFLAACYLLYHADKRFF